MLQDRPPAAPVVELANRGLRQQFAALGGVQRAGAYHGAGGHLFLPGLRSQEGIQVCHANFVDDAQNSTLVAEEATGGIAE